MDIFIYGLVTGSILLICALGFSMTLKTEGFINVAHGQMLMLGAYFTLGLTYIGLPFLVAAILSVILCGLAGLAFQRILFKPIKSSGILVQLFTSVGLAYLINGLVGAIAGKRMLSFDIPIEKIINPKCSIPSINIKLLQIVTKKALVISRPFSYIIV